MNRGRFLRRDGHLCGFDIQGHAGAGSRGNDIVCAAVSSAAYLVANTMTEVMGIAARIEVQDGRMALLVPQKECTSACLQMLEGLLLHLTELSKEYPKNIMVSISEV